MSKVEKTCKTCLCSRRDSNPATFFCTNIHGTVALELYNRLGICHMWRDKKAEGSLKNVVGRNG